MKDLLEEFKNSLEENGGSFHLIEREKLIELIMDIAGKNDIMYSGLDESIENEIKKLNSKLYPLDILSNEKNLKEKIRDVRVGITGTDALAAESGSIVLVDFNLMKSFAAFLPEIHIAIADDKKIFPTLLDAIDHVMKNIKGNASAIQIIQGPSKTGDIEKKIVRPSHGPKELHVILLR